MTKPVIARTLIGTPIRIHKGNDTAINVRAKLKPQ
jgi:hypothetical protein